MPATTSDPRRAAKRRTALISAVVVFGMTGAAFAAVPLYRRFCQLTGFDGTVRKAEAAPTQVLDRPLLIRFDTNVQGVPWEEAKWYAANQVADEARHNEVLQRYVDLRLDGEIYPVGGNVREIFDTLLGTSSWYLKTIGLQLVAETFAVSLFRMLAESSKEAVLRQVCSRILQDEARHMGFAMLSLPELVAQASDAEHREMEDFAVWALGRTLGGTFPLAVYQEMGMSKAELE